MQIGFCKDFITEAVNARVLFIVQQKVDTVHKERFAAIGDTAGIQGVCDVCQACAVRIIGEYLQKHGGFFVYDG